MQWIKNLDGEGIEIWNVKNLNGERNRSLECALIWSSLGTSFYLLQLANKGIIYSTWIFCSCTQYFFLGTTCNDFLQTASPNYTNRKFLPSDKQFLSFVCLFVLRWLPRLALIKRSCCWDCFNISFKFYDFLSTFRKLNPGAWFICLVYS